MLTFKFISLYWMFCLNSIFLFICFEFGGFLRLEGGVFHHSWKFFCHCFFKHLFSPFSFIPSETSFRHTTDIHANSSLHVSQLLFMFPIPWSLLNYAWFVSLQLLYSLHFWFQFYYNGPFFHWIFTFNITVLFLAVLLDSLSNLIIFYCFMFHACTFKLVFYFFKHSEYFMFWIWKLQIL